MCSALIIPFQKSRRNAARSMFTTATGTEQGINSGDDKHHRATSCACPAGRSVVNGVCTCPTGQGVQNGACVACTGGQEVQETAFANAAAGQELQNGTCAPIQCPEGQKLFVDELYSEYAGCHDAEIVDSAEDCRAKDWVARAVNFGRANLFCDIPFTRYLASGGNVSDTSCIINPAESSTVANKCRDLFGNPSQFPPATGDLRTVRAM